MWNCAVHFYGRAYKLMCSLICGVTQFMWTVKEVSFRTLAKPVKWTIESFKRTGGDEQLEYSDVENQNEDTYDAVVDNRLQHEVKRLKKSLADEQEKFQRQFQKLEKEHSNKIADLSKETSRIKREKSDLQRKCRNMKTTLNDLQTDYQILQTNKDSECKDLQEQHKREADGLQRSLIDMKGKLESEQKTNENLKNRLSKALSNQLHDNNPNIADLSDENRPTKLTEKFSELYDNEWTNAYGVLQGYYEEYQIICMLLDIFMDCHQKCREQATKQLESVRTKYKNISPADLKHLKDERKKHAQLTLPIVIQLISISGIEHIFIEHKCSPEIIKSSEMQIYNQRCIELSWFMAVQDPPVAITTEVPKNLMYNKNIFKEYTKTGKYVEYVVWPAILIQDGGALMAKGIVQCCDRPEDSKVRKLRNSWQN